MNTKQKTNYRAKKEVAESLVKSLNVSMAPLRYVGLQAGLPRGNTLLERHVELIREADIFSGISDAAKEVDNDLVINAVQTFQELRDMQFVYAQVIANFRKNKPILPQVRDQLTEQQAKAIDLLL